MAPLPADSHSNFLIVVSKYFVTRYTCLRIILLPEFDGNYAADPDPCRDLVQSRSRTWNPRVNRKGYDTST